MRQQGWRLAVKQVFDRTAAAIGLVVLSPVLATTALAIRATMGSPVLFRQARGGRYGIPFDVIKFRTMLDAVDAHGEPLPDDRRLTKLGAFLRNASIDELPQLLNVLRGEVSIVGPRPFLARYLARYTPQQARRHDVLPGITGWSQINGRNSITWLQKFEHDLWYVDNWSLALDAKIFAVTVIRVFQRRGVASEGHPTMPEFYNEA
ncbi:MAG: sugar transferase [Deltaproteobacteria bacterium]|nr:sugar transferase [Deltaproteobacteria bacterium]